jgi:hypothetical protein
MAGAKSSLVLINALIGKVGPGTEMSGYPTYRALAAWQFLILVNFSAFSSFCASAGASSCPHRVVRKIKWNQAKPLK